MGIERTNPEDLGKEELAEYCIQLLFNSFQARREDMETNARIKRMYSAKDEPKVSTRINSGRISEDTFSSSHAYLPVTTGIVDTAKSLIYANLFGTPDYLRCVAENPNDEERSIGTCRFLKRRHEQMGMTTHVADDMILEALLYDFTVTLNSWHIAGSNKVMPIDEEEILDLGGGIRFASTQTRNRVVWDPDAIARSNTRVVPNEQCFPDSMAVHDFGDFFCIAEDVSQNFLMENRKTADNPFGIYEFNPDDISPGDFGIFDRKDSVLDRRAYNKRFTPTRLQNVTKIIVFFKNYMVELTSDRTILRRQKTTGYPLDKYSFRKMNDRFGGLGMVRVFERVQHDMNRMIRDRRDFNDRIINPITLIEKEMYDRGEFGDGTMTPGQVFTFEKGEIPAKDRMHIAQMGNPLTQDHQNEMALSFEVIQNVSNIGENAQGNFSGGRRSATEAREVAGALDTSMGVTSLFMERQILDRTYDKQLTLERIHFNRDEIFRDTGDPDMYIEMNPQMLHFRTSPRIMAQGMANLRMGAVDKAQFMQSASIALGSEILMKYTDEEELAKAFWKHSLPNTYFRMLNTQKPSDNINIPPEVENQMFGNGQKPPVKPINEHAIHIQSHRALQSGSTYRAWPEHMKAYVDQHIQIHEAAMQAAISAQTQSARPDRLGQTQGSNILSSSPVAETPVQGAA